MIFCHARAAEDPAEAPSPCEGCQQPLCTYDGHTTTKDCWTAGLGSRPGFPHEVMGVEQQFNLDKNKGLDIYL